MMLQGIAAALGRLDNIASTGSPNPVDKFAAYEYMVASTLLKVDYPAVTGGVALTYKGLGRQRLQRLRPLRPGRVAAVAEVNGTAADRYFYGYDRSGNRKWPAERASAYPLGPTTPSRLASP